MSDLKLPTWIEVAPDCHPSLLEALKLAFPQDTFEELKPKTEEETE